MGKKTTHNNKNSIICTEIQVAKNNQNKALKMLCYYNLFKKKWISVIVYVAVFKPIKRTRDFKPLK